MASRIEARSRRQEAQRSLRKDSRAARSRIAAAWVGVAVVASLVLAGCLAQWWWGLKIEGEHGQVRVLDDGPPSGFGQDGRLHVLPAYIQDFEYVGETPDEPLRVAAVPACGYRFEEWGRGASAGATRDPFLSVEPAFQRYRSVEVTFVPSAEDSNDCFSTPTALTSIGSSGSVEFDNRRAGLEEGEPEHARTVCEEGREAGDLQEHYCGAGASMWWTFDVPSNGALFLSVVSDFQSVVAVYQGSSLEDLVPLADCVRVGGCQGVEVPVAEGDALRVAVDGWGSGCLGCPTSLVAAGPVGSGTLDWQFVPSADTVVVRP